ncbi:MAG: MATE family efflux transporter [Hydrogeniiclostridium mannosilyticum]
MGDDAIAANSVASVVFQILTVVVYGAANASSIIIGKTIGQGAEKLVRLYAKTLQVLYYCLVSPPGCAYFSSATGCWAFMSFRRRANNWPANL